MQYNNVLCNLFFDYYLFFYKQFNFVVDEVKIKQNFMRKFNFRLIFFMKNHPSLIVQRIIKSCINSVEEYSNAIRNPRMLNMAVEASHSLFVLLYLMQN